ncbi:MAG: hypothetical protein GQ542_03820 [Desulforhopalus sp.]|nr:hypothetical protein [Desulforhopalus sp.]
MSLHRRLGSLGGRIFLKISSVFFARGEKRSSHYIIVCPQREPKTAHFIQNSCRKSTEGSFSTLLSHPAYRLSAQTLTSLSDTDVKEEWLWLKTGVFDERLLK